MISDFGYEERKWSCYLEQLKKSIKMENFLNDEWYNMKQKCMFLNEKIWQINDVWQVFDMDDEVMN